MTADNAALAPVLAQAKVNLSLHITGRRDDGYHLLDSLVAFADMGDHLTLTPGDALSIEVTGPFASGVPNDARNLVWQAAEGAGWTGHIKLAKNLPHGAGIGGGSSDAAAVLNVLSAQGIEAPEGLALSLGADVPVCVRGRATRMRGIGEDLSEVELPQLHALLVNPGVHVPTGAVFAGLTCRNNAPMPDKLPTFKGPADCAAWLSEQRNDLELPAIQTAPVVDRVLSDLRATADALMARMSGSGATCFALYPTKKAAHMAAYDLGTEQAEWWCYAATLS